MHLGGDMEGGQSHITKFYKQSLGNLYIPRGSKVVLFGYVLLFSRGNSTNTQHITLY